jgi:hypothetical protein
MNANDRKYRGGVKFVLTDGVGHAIMKKYVSRASISQYAPFIAADHHHHQLVHLRTMLDPSKTRGHINEQRVSFYGHSGSKGSVYYMRYRNRCDSM